MDEATHEDHGALRARITDVIAPRVGALRSFAQVACALGLVACIVSFFQDQKSFFHSYLYAWFFWTCVSAGCVGLMMLHNTVSGGWGVVIRRFLEAGSRQIWVMAVLFLPIAYGLHQHGLYEWATPEAAARETIRAKALWLNVPAFYIRTAFYFAFWIGISQYLLSLSARLDRGEDPAAESLLNRWSAGGLVVHVLVSTFAGVDWITSLTPEWFSSIYGLLVVATQALSGLAVMLVLVAFLGRGSDLLDRAPKKYFRDLGNLMLATVLLWAYMSFSQYLITYSGNTAEEITFYVRRANGGWGWVSLLLIPVHFLLPFLWLLVGSETKRSPQRLARVAAYLILARLLDIFWWVAPTFRPEFTLTAADIGAPLLLGGIWLLVWLVGLRPQTVAPVYDSRLRPHFHEVADHA